MTAARTVLAWIGSLIGLVLTLPLLVLGLPFWALAGLTRILRAVHERFEPAVMTWHALVEFEPVIGWKPRGGLDAYGRADEPFRLTTDRDGWRGRADLADSEIVVFGDSFAFGFGIDDGDFFATRSRDVRIKTVGAAGYNMIQELLWMRRLAPRLRGKLVIWFVYHGNDLYENLQPNLDHYRMPFVRERAGSQGWEIVTSHVSRERWSASGKRNYYHRLAELCSPSFLAARAFSACEFLIGEGRNVCGEAGAHLVVATIPDITQISPTRMELLLSLAPDRATFDPNLPDRKIAGICERLGVPFVALKDHLVAADYKENDVHWSARGHRRIADVLANLYRRHTSPAETLS